MLHRRAASAPHILPQHCALCQQRSDAVRWMRGRNELVDAVGHAATCGSDDSLKRCERCERCHSDPTQRKRRPIETKRSEAKRNETKRNETKEKERTRCDAMRCDAMRCDAMRCDATRFAALRCNAARRLRARRRPDGTSFGALRAYREAYRETYRETYRCAPAAGLTHNLSAKGRSAMHVPVPGWSAEQHVLALRARRHSWRDICWRVNSPSRSLSRNLSRNPSMPAFEPGAGCGGIR